MIAEPTARDAGVPVNCQDESHSEETSNDLGASGVQSGEFQAAMGTHVAGR